MATKRDQAGVARLSEPGLYRFSSGLYLQVRGPDAKSWIYRYTIDGRTRFKGLGSARNVSFASARKAVDELRITQVSKKIDPIAEAEKRAAEIKRESVRQVPFRQRAEEYIHSSEGHWRNQKHRAQWRSSLAAYAYPIIGDLVVEQVTVRHIVEILRPIWVEKHETARRVRGRIETVLDYFVDPDDTAWLNPARLTAQLSKKLPKLQRGRGTLHFASLPYEQIGEFFQNLRGREGIAARALEFAILTATRTGEVIGVTWSELDIPNKTWTVPSSRMKAGRSHRVPLSDEAIALLARIPREPKVEVVFWSAQTGRPLSNMAMLALLRRMGRNDVTTHGMRSTFRTWAAEQTTFAREVAEAALAHTLEDKTEAAYQRGDLFEKRRRLMEAWATYCAEPRPVESGIEAA